jgi:hypothetical protein
MRMIVDSLSIPVSTIYIHLVEKLGLKHFLLRWVPYTLTSELSQRRVELAGLLLCVYAQSERVGFHDVVIGDESWFLQRYNHR